MIENIVNIFELCYTYHFPRLFCVDETNQKETLFRCVLVTCAGTVKRERQWVRAWCYRHVNCEFIERIHHVNVSDGFGSMWNNMNWFIGCKLLSRIRDMEFTSLKCDAMLGFDILSLPSMDERMNAFMYMNIDGIMHFHWKFQMN